MFCFNFCFRKAAEAVRSLQLQIDRLTFQRINRANSLILNSFLVAASNATRFGIFSIVQLERKKDNQQ